MEVYIPAYNRQYASNWYTSNLKKRIMANIL